MRRLHRVRGGSFMPEQGLFNSIRINPNGQSHYIRVLVEMRNPVYRILQPARPRESLIKDSAKPRAVGQHWASVIELPPELHHAAGSLTVVQSDAAIPLGRGW